MRPPCKNCELREVGCSSRCKSYIQYKKTMDAAKAKRDQDSQYISYQIELQYNRARKRKSHH